MEAEAPPRLLVSRSCQGFYHIQKSATIGIAEQLKTNYRPEVQNGYRNMIASILRKNDLNICRISLTEITNGCVTKVPARIIRKVQDD